MNKPNYLTGSIEVETRKVLPYKGIFPNIHDSVFIADGVSVIGDVVIGESSGIFLRSVIKVPAPIMQFSPISLLFNKIAPIPIRQLLPTVVPCSITL